uniref:Uncharacterized protein n=1 Tax=Schistocephalus solidus TaxID=70667 RepID=A0A0V0J6A9_SCHSO
MKPVIFMAKTEGPAIPDVYLSGACISGLSTCVFADPQYHEGFLIGEFNGSQNQGINIYGMLPFRIFGPESCQEIEEKRRRIEDGGQAEIFGVYRCREKMGDHKISVNDFLAIDHFNARLFCLIEKSYGDYSIVEQTLFRCEKAQGRWSIRKIPFGVWSLANHETKPQATVRRMHGGPDLKLSTDYMSHLLAATKSMIQGANDRLEEKSQELMASVEQWQAKHQNFGTTSLESYLSNAPAVPPPRGTKPYSSNAPVGNTQAERLSNEQDSTVSDLQNKQPSHTNDPQSSTSNYLRD